MAFHLVAPTSLQLGDENDDGHDDRDEELDVDHDDERDNGREEGVKDDFNKKRDGGAEDEFEDRGGESQGGLHPKVGHDDQHEHVHKFFNDHGEPRRPAPRGKP